jgi:hypothetical protein
MHLMVIAGMKVLAALLTNTPVDQSLAKACEGCCWDCE